MAHAPLTFSRVIRSMWITHLRRYTCTTFPSRFLKVPRTTCTSSSLRIGTERTCTVAHLLAVSGVQTCHRLPSRLPEALTITRGGVVAADSWERL